MIVLVWCMSPVFALWDAYTFWRHGLEVDPNDPRGLRLRRRAYADRS